MPFISRVGGSYQSDPSARRRQIIRSSSLGQIIAATISPSTSSLNEGSSVVFTVTTTNVSNGTTLYWTTNAVSGTIDTSDFSDSAVSGSFTINNNTATITRTLRSDATTEGSESFQLQIRSGSISGTIIATSSTITVGDTSLTPTYFVNPVVSSVDEGSSVNFTVTTTNIANGTTLYWTVTGVSGTINASDFSDSAVSGSFTVNNNAATITRTLASDTTTEGSESFQLQIRTGSVSGTVVATSATVSINDTSTSTTSGLTITSAAFTNNGTIPDRCRFGGGCGGFNSSPQLTWSIGSLGTIARWRLRCIDISAGNFVHWSVDNIPATNTTFWIASNGSFPTGSTINQTGWWPDNVLPNGWGGPCPPAGTGTHDYVFTVTGLTSGGAEVTSASITGRAAPFVATPPVDPPVDPPMQITVTSTTFVNNQQFPTRCGFGGTCGGTNTSPQLSWSAPSLTLGDMEIASWDVRVIDTTNGVRRELWNVAQIPANGSRTFSIAENGTFPIGHDMFETFWTQQGLAHLIRSNGWGGPCTPSATRSMEIQVVGFDSTLGNMLAIGILNYTFTA